MHDEGNELQLYIGPSIHGRLYEGDRLSQQIHRVPFNSLQAFYDSVLDLTERYVNDLKLNARPALDEATIGDGISVLGDLKVENEPCLQLDGHEIDEPRNPQQGCQNLGDAIFTRADTDDRANELRWRPRRSTLSRTSKNMGIYRFSLQAIYSTSLPSEPMTTMFVHPDLSMVYIFVNDSLCTCRNHRLGTSSPGAS